MKERQGFVWLIGDTHGMIHDSMRMLDEMGKEIAKENNFEKHSIFNKNDFVTISGDAGFLWKQKQDEYESRILGKLNKKFAFSVAFIDGNHENFQRLNALPVVQKYGSEVGQVSRNVCHLKRGHIYTINSLKFFCLGGGNSMDKGFRVKGESWWGEELVNLREKRFAEDNLAAHNWQVDYVITHVAPRSIIAETFPDFVENPSRHSQYYDPTELYLEKLFPKISFKEWFCGHYHINRVVPKYKLRILDQDLFCLRSNQLLNLYNDAFREQYKQYLIDEVL